MEVLKVEVLKEVLMTESELSRIQNLQSELDAAKATLERVRAVTRDIEGAEYLQDDGETLLSQLLWDALASQPEAPHTNDCERVTHPNSCHPCDCQPDAPSLGHPGADAVFRDLQARRAKAPKGPAAEAVPLVEWQRMERDLAAAKAQIEGLSAALERRQQTVNEANTMLLETRAALNAANARADAAEQENATNNAAATQYEADIKELRARADAAEREVQDLCGSLRVEKAEHVELAQKLDAAETRVIDLGRRIAELVADDNAWRVQRDQLAQKLEATERRSEQVHHAYAELSVERDKLAARVKELSPLINPEPAYTCTLEEREVLDVVRRWLDCDVTSVAHIATAELANRAAKANRAVDYEPYDTSDCDQSRASCSKADPASEDEESDIVIAGRQLPFVQVGMIVHPDDCPNCERERGPWCSALVCDIHDDDETARFGMMATLLFRNGERLEEPCDELRRRWRLARDFDQARVYTGRWGAIPRGSVWPVAEVCEEA